MIALFIFVFVSLLIIFIIMCVRDYSIQKEGREIQQRYLEAKKALEDKKRELGIKESPAKKRHEQQRLNRHIDNRIDNMYMAHEIYGDNIPDYVVDSIMLGVWDTDPFLDDFEDDFDDF